MRPRSPDFLIHKLSLAFLIYVCVVASNALSTPQPQQPTVQSAENSQTAPPLRVTTHLVLVNVIVNDRHGNPIAGLTKEDFSVLDNRKLQEIQVFSAETNLPEQPLPATPAPDIYTNRISEHANVPASVTVILLDALNTEFADQALTRKQVLKLLEQIRPQDRIALYWLGNNLYALQDFTSDAASLRAAVLRSTPSSSREQSESNVNYLTLNSPNPSVPGRLSESQNSSREAFRSAFDQRVANQSVKNRVGLTLAALIAIANHVSDLKGRKSLVWVSGSFPFALGQEKFDLNWANDTDGQGFSAEIGRAALALTAAGVAVYPVDARGLMGNGVTAAGDYSEAPPPEFAEGDEHLPTRTVSGDLETMKVLAERTGGKAFYGSNNLSDAIQRAIDDSRVSYTLGFYPVNAKWDGSFHNIKVRVRTPGAKVRSRTGYFALPDSTNTPAKSLQAIISQTAISQLDATAIGLRVHVQPPSTPAQQFLAVDLHLDLHDIHMEQINGRWTSTLQTAFLQLSSHGEIIHAIDEVLQLTLPPAAYEQAQKDGLRNTRQIRVQPGAAQLCVVIRDPTTGKIGSLSIPLAKYLSTPSAPAN